MFNNSISSGTIIVSPQQQQYVVTQNIGQGGFGNVVVAERKTDQEKFILKLFDFNNQDETESLLEEFVREVALHKILRRQNKTDDNLCKLTASCGISSFISTKDFGVIVMPFSPPDIIVDLQTFMDDEKSGLKKEFDRLKNKFPPPFDFAMMISKDFRKIQQKLFNLIAEMFDDLSRLHENGIAHQDLKPSNILFNQDFWEDPLIPSTFTVFIDFNASYSNELKKNFPLFSTEDNLLGISDARKKLINLGSIQEKEWPIGTIPRFLRTPSIIGTRGYEDPELDNINSSRLTIERLKQADIYSMGIIIYELFTNKIPFQKQRFPRQNKIPLSVFNLFQEMTSTTVSKRKSASEYKTVFDILRKAEEDLNQKTKKSRIQHELFNKNV